MSNSFSFFEVGGCVRDDLLGVPTKDIDFSVVANANFASANSAFATLILELEEQGFKLFEIRAEFFTIRAQIPGDHPLRARTNVADFVLARLDGPYSDGRRPDWVKPGTLQDDILRRDFTVNALARNIRGDIVDLVGGQGDLEANLLRFVGVPCERIAEDGLRVMRGFRFYITKGFDIEPETWDALTSEFAAKMLSKVAVERIREELVKMFRANTLHSLRLLGELPRFTQEAIFRDGLRLDATLAS